MRIQRGSKRKTIKAERHSKDEKADEDNGRKRGRGKMATEVGNPGDICKFRRDS